MDRTKSQFKLPEYEIDKGDTLKAVSEKFGVSDPTLSSWKRSGRPSVKSGPDEDIKLLRLENEYLKKKVADYETRAYSIGLLIVH